jgi:RNA polymerase sigma factor (sigma-70 family)
MAERLDSVRLAELVVAIASGDSAAEDTLYRAIAPGMKIIACKRIEREHVDDIVQDSFLAVLEAIRANRIEHPDKLIGFVRTTLRYHIIAVIDQRVKARESVELEYANPAKAPGFDEEQEVREQVEMARQVLARMKPREGEVLHRFYILEQPASEICQDLGLNPDQFRNLKHRAKQAVNERLGRLLERRPPTSLKRAG